MRLYEMEGDVEESLVRETVLRRREIVSKFTFLKYSVVIYVP